MELEPKFPYCNTHKFQPLNWVCLEANCEARLFCSHCIIFGHKNFHQNYNEISQILKDPLPQLFTSNHLRNSTISEQISEILSKFVQQEEEKLTDIYNKIISDISRKFEEIRKKFHEDIAKFLDENQETYKKIDAQRKDYLSFCSNYFNKSVIENRESLKEGLNLVLNKFNMDNELKKMFDDTVDAIPQVNEEKNIDIIVSSRKLHDLTWNFFMDKTLHFGANPGVWTFDASILGEELIFSNNNLTVKSKPNITYATTLLGSKVFKSGVHRWNVCIDALSGVYVCIGIIGNNPNINFRANNYSIANCVCSDKYVYGLNKINGDIVNGIDQGDVLEFTLNFDEDVFQVKNGAHFEYQLKNIKNKEFVPYFGFSNFNATQLSLFF